MMAALHQNLCSAEIDRFVDLSIHFFLSDHVSIRVFLGAVESAKLTIDVANIRVVYVAINDVGDDLVSAPVVGRRTNQLSSAMCQRTEFFQRKPVKLQRVL